VKPHSLRLLHAEHSGHRVEILPLIKPESNETCACLGVHFCRAGSEGPASGKSQPPVRHVNCLCVGGFDFQPGTAAHCRRPGFPPQELCSCGSDSCVPKAVAELRAGSRGGFGGQSQGSRAVPGSGTRHGAGGFALAWRRGALETDCCLSRTLFVTSRTPHLVVFIWKKDIDISVFDQEIKLQLCSLTVPVSPAVCS